MLKRVIEYLAVLGLLMVLVGVAAFYLASLDKHPKNPRYMVRLEVR